VPGVTSANDSSGVELGVRFHSDVDGSITGIRFYKGAGNTGTHTGNLWTTSGSRLATATFSNETASGWQQVNLATPVTISANTDYIASYYAPAGHYAENAGYFAGSGVDNPPLHVPASTASTPNGVYHYGTSSGFPASTYQATNYWVDVVFVASAGPDTTPPNVSAISPAANATGVPVATTPTAIFSEPVQAATVSFVLRDPGNAVVPATVTYDSATNTAKVTPSSLLAASPRTRRRSTAPRTSPAMP
jgi:hypothetical protein